MIQYIIGEWVPVETDGCTYFAFLEFDDEPFSSEAAALARVDELQRDDIDFTDFGVVLRKVFKPVRRGDFS